MVIQVIIRDKSLVLHPGDIKAFFLQSMLGLEYMHACWILHRVGSPRCGFMLMLPWTTARTFRGFILMLAMFFMLASNTCWHLTSFLFPGH